MNSPISVEDSTVRIVAQYLLVLAICGLSLFVTRALVGSSEAIRAAWIAGVVTGSITQVVFR